MARAIGEREKAGPVGAAAIVGIVRSALQPWVRPLLCAMLLGLAAYASLRLTIGDGSIAAVWLPNGMIVAYLFHRREAAPARFIGLAFVANVIASIIVRDAVWLSIGLAAAKSIEILIIFWGMVRCRNSPPDLRSLPDLIRFCFYGGAIGPAVSGLIAIAVLQPVGLQGGLDLWAIWAMTDGLGVVIVAPTLVILWAAWDARASYSQAAMRDWLTSLSVGAFVTAAIFSQSSLPLLFLVMPVTLINASRLGLLGTATSIVTITTISSVATALGYGPIHLVQGGLTTQLLTLQLFLATNFAMGLPVAMAIGAKRSIQLELECARDLSRSMLENMREIIFRTDAEGRWEFLNPAWETITGYPVADILGTSATELIHPDDAVDNREAQRRLVDGTVDHILLRQRYFHASGGYRMVEVSVRALRGEAGDYRGSIGSIRDITEQDHAEVALSESQRLFQTLADFSPAGIIRCDADGRVTYGNQAWLRFVGMTLDEALGSGWAKALHPDDSERIAAGWTVAVSALIDYRAEFRFRTPQGREFWVDAHTTAIRDPSGHVDGFVVVLFDTTARKALEDQLVFAKRHAEAAAVAKSNFLANMSHEIRTPMNGVLGFADLLLDSQLADDQRRHVRMIADSGGEMMRLLNDILDISKIEAGQMQVIDAPIDVRHIVQQCNGLMEACASRKGLHLSLEIASDLAPLVMGDAHRLRQVLLNLIGNAIKFTERGTVIVRACSSQRDTRGQTILRFEVEDSGIGIPLDRQAAVFHPFEQVDAGLARSFGGTGLGLSICRHLAALMGGDLALRSTVGVGSLFTLTIPAMVVDNARPAPPLAPAISLVPDAAPRALAKGAVRGHLLLAEDLDINQLLVTEMLERMGYVVELAVDGADAVARIAVARADNRLFDLVLMDIQMPRMDGYEATRIIRGQGLTPDILPIIALTANAYGEDIASCLAAGMQAHIAKPIQRRLLEDTVARWACRPASPIADPAPPPLSMASPKAEAALAAGQAVRAGLADKFAEHKAMLLDALSGLVERRRTHDAEFDALIVQLHNLAGTAGFFGEGQLGDAARELEFHLKHWSSEERRKRFPAAAKALLRAA